jgi:hypothetical protein
VENFAKEFFEQAKFEREVVVLSSGECVTATWLVQKIACARTRCRKWRWARFSQDQEMHDESAASHANFFIGVRREWQSRAQSSAKLFARV